jgi:hypothetical protein
LGSQGSIVVAAVARSIAMWTAVWTIARLARIAWP